MPVLENAKHERFAQGLARGLGVTEAYVTAGFADSPASASRLSKKVNIRNRVKELQQKGATRTAATVESCTYRLRAAYAMALKKRNPSAAISAVMAEARLNGLMKEKHEHTGPAGGPLQFMNLDPEALKGMSDAEIDALEKAVGRLQRGDDCDQSGEAASASEDEYSASLDSKEG